MALNTQTSIVDLLKSQGKDSSYASRTALAKQYGISNYTGTSEQNKQLLGFAGTQQAPAATTAPVAPVDPAAMTKADIGTPEVPNTSLTGTMSGTSSEERTLTPPAGIGSIDNYKAGINLVNDYFRKTGPNPEDIIKQALSSLGEVRDPNVMGGVLGNYSALRQQNVSEIQKNALDLIAEQQKSNTEKFSAIMERLPKSLQINGKEYDELKSGNVSVELQKKIADAVAVEQKTEQKAPTITKITDPNTGEEQTVQWDDLTKSWKPISISSAPVQPEQQTKQTFEQYLSQEQEKAGQSFAPQKVEQLRKQFETQKLAPQAVDYKQSALDVILGSGKFTKEQKRDLVKTINSGQDPLTVIKNQAKNIMGQTEAQKLSGFETAKQQLESINVLLKDYYDKGGETSLFKGGYEKVINKLGSVKNPELVEIATNISAALQIYRNAVSGTAYSEQEGADIASIFPGINKSEGLNQAIVSGRLKAFDTTIDANYRNTLGNVYDDLKKGKDNEKYSSPVSFIKNASPSDLDEYENILNLPQLQGASDDEVFEEYKKIKGFSTPLSMGEKDSTNSIKVAVAQKFPDGAQGGQCGDFAHKIVQFPSVGDSKTEKIASVSKYGIQKNEWLAQGPQVGDVIITNENPTYGHVAVVNAILPNGQLQLSESNYKQKQYGREKVSNDRIISPNSANIYGAIRGTLKV